MIMILKVLIENPVTPGSCARVKQTLSGQARPVLHAYAGDCNNEYYLPTISELMLFNTVYKFPSVTLVVQIRKAVYEPFDERMQ